MSHTSTQDEIHADEASKAEATQDSVQETVQDAVDADETLTVEAPAHELQPQTFADFKVHPDIVTALSDVGITHPFPVQSMTLPIALAGHDIIGQAKTGTGKTLGFGIPALQRVLSPTDEGFDQLPSPGTPQALVVVPTRELAVQVATDLGTAARKRNTRIATIYGGRAYEPQIEALQNGVELVVGTPGRLIDLQKQGHLNLRNVRIAVLDEADEMLDLGFLPDVETLLAAVPATRQTMLFSATMPGPVVAMARRYMSKPTHMRATDPDDEGLTKRDIRQLVYRAHAMDKDEVLARILQARGRGRTIIFTKTKRTAARVADELIRRGFAAAPIHGDLGQGAREQALRAFRHSNVDVLVATDVAARGIDVDDVTHVINFQCVEDEKIYLHRVGRTGRAGHKGTAVTFVDWDDVPRWNLINKGLGLDFHEPVETYSSSPHLYTDLDIPEGTKGRLPRHARTNAGLDAEALEDLGETGKRHSSSRDERRGGSGRNDSGRGASNRGGSGRGSSGRGGSSQKSSGRSDSARNDSSRNGSSRDGAGRGSSDTEHAGRGRSRRRRSRNDQSQPQDSGQNTSAPNTSSQDASGRDASSQAGEGSQGPGQSRHGHGEAGRSAGGDRPRRTRSRRRTRNGRTTSAEATDTAQPQ